MIKQSSNILQPTNYSDMYDLLSLEVIEALREADQAGEVSAQDQAQQRAQFEQERDELLTIDGLDQDEFLQRYEMALVKSGATSKEVLHFNALMTIRADLVTGTLIRTDTGRIDTIIDPSNGDDVHAGIRPTIRRDGNGEYDFAWKVPVLGMDSFAFVMWQSEVGREEILEAVAIEAVAKHKSFDQQESLLRVYDVLGEADDADELRDELIESIIDYLDHELLTFAMSRNPEANMYKSLQMLQRLNAQAYAEFLEKLKARAVFLGAQAAQR